MSAPNFRELLRIDEERLASQLRSVRAAITHAGEKGRGLEHEAISVLRRLLPAEYGLATGFIAAAQLEETGRSVVELSPQIDIIIYDAVRGGALIDLGSSQVFPIECVVGVVEVKATLYDQIPDLYRDSAAVRSLRQRHYLLDHRREQDLLREYEDHIDTLAQGGEAWMGRVRRATIADMFPPPRAVSVEWLPVRCFALAFEYGREFDAEAAQRRAEEKFVSPGHLHAAFVPGTCVLWNELADKDPSREGKVRVETGEPFAVFRHRLVDALSNFPRPAWGASMDLRPYFGEAPDL